ncbi:MAG: DUF6356 family protein [Bacteroidota bacterium]
MKKSNIFTEHPKQVKMTYLQHTRFALMLAGRTLGCAFASLVHAFFPFLFVTHTSTTIRELNMIFEKRFGTGN